MKTKTFTTEDTGDHRVERVGFRDRNLVQACVMKTGRDASTPLSMTDEIKTFTTEDTGDHRVGREAFRDRNPWAGLVS